MPGFLYKSVVLSDTATVVTSVQKEDTDADPTRSSSSTSTDVSEDEGELKL